MNISNEIFHITRDFHLHHENMKKSKDARNHFKAL